MKKDIVMPVENIDRLCYVAHVDSYIGWKYGQANLYVSTNKPTSAWGLVLQEPDRAVI